MDIQMWFNLNFFFKSVYYIHKLLQTQSTTAVIIFSLGDGLDSVFVCTRSFVVDLSCGHNIKTKLSFFQN